MAKERDNAAFYKRVRKIWNTLSEIDSLDSDKISEIGYPLGILGVNLEYSSCNIVYRLPNQNVVHICLEVDSVDTFIVEHKNLGVISCPSIGKLILDDTGLKVTEYFKLKLDYTRLSVTPTIEHGEMVQLIYNSILTLEKYVDKLVKECMPYVEFQDEQLKKLACEFK